MKTNTTRNAYDAFSSDYDRFVNWGNRLNAELPFLTGQLSLLQSGDGKKISVLDAACGTGMHAIALARVGFHTAGADISSQMIKKADANAKQAGLPISFKALGFGALAGAFGENFDALMCLGNSLPHLLTIEEIIYALKDFAACLRPGGLIILQNRNFDAVMEKKERWFPPQYHKHGDEERLFIRFYDFDEDGMITFHIMRLRRTGQSGWQQEIDSVRLFPLTKIELEKALLLIGFEDLQFFGALDDLPFDPEKSANLVITVRKPA